MIVNFPAFTYRANIARIVDGDTFDLDIDLGLGVWKRRERVRLYGINVAERYTDIGKQATAFLREMFPPAAVNPVIITTFKDSTDKYGRYLAKIMPVVPVEWDDLTSLLIEKRFGVPYFGGARGAEMETGPEGPE